jgi:hypothetical protein
VAPSPGKFFVKVDAASEVVRAWLFNFDVGKATLKREHIDLLDSAIAPVLKDGGSIKLLGLASTTGSVVRDKQLGEERTHAVVAHLRRTVGSAFHMTKELSLGKTMALAFEGAHIKGGTKDNVEDEVWRAVVLNAWNRGAPPPPPPPLDVPFTNSTWADTVSKALDVTSMSLSLIDLAVDLLEISEASTVTGAGGLIVGGIGAIVQLPLIFAAIDAFQNTNGQISGAASTIQALADQYSESAIPKNTPMSKWPPIKIPELNEIDPTPAFRAGALEGRTRVLKKVAELEKNPKSVTLESGKQVRISGRVWLRALSFKFKDNVGVEVVIKPTNEELKKRGLKPFPTRP